MANLAWQKLRNLENSFAEFIQTAVTNAGLTVLDQKGQPKAVTVHVGYEFDTTLSLPCIQIYIDGKISPRLSVGSNLRLNSYLLIIDIRALDKGSQLDLTEWVTDLINDGFDVYNYAPNPSDPSNPIKTLMGYVNIDFVSNTPLNFGTSAEMYDKYRQNISISVDF